MRSNVHLTSSVRHDPGQGVRTFEHMRTYDTLSEAVNDLQQRGYTDQLEQGGHVLVSRSRGVDLDPDEFEIDEFHRFEGETNPADASILYAISSDRHDIHGLLISAYGAEASTLTQAMVSKLSTHPDR